MVEQQATVAGDDPPVTAAAPGRHSVVRNALHLLYSQTTTWVMATLVTVVQPRFLGPAAQGQLRLAFSVWAIAQVLINLGTSNLLTLEIARDRDKGLTLIGPVITLRLLAYIASTVVLGAYIAIVRPGGHAVALIALVGVSSLFASVAGAARAALMGLEHMSYPALSDIVAKAVQTLAILAVLFGGGDARAVAAMVVVGSVVNSVMMYRFLRRFPGATTRLHLSHAWSIVRRSSGYLVSEATLIGYQQVDTVVMAILVNARELGWYGTAETLYTSMLFVPTIVMASLFPVIGRLHVENPERLKTLVQKTFSNLLLAVVPLGLGTFAIAQPVSLLLFGNEYRQTGPVLAIMGLVLILISMTILFGQVAIATGRQAFWNVLMLGAIAASIPLDIVFVPWMEHRYHNGAIGGSLSYLVTEGAMAVIGLWRIAPEVLNRDAVVRSLKTLAAGGLMLAAVWPVRERFLAIPIAVGIVVYLAGVIILRILSADDRARIRSAAARLRRAAAGA